jgi:hypothetical protein
MPDWQPSELFSLGDANRITSYVEGVITCANPADPNPLDSRVALQHLDMFQVQLPQEQIDQKMQRQHMNGVSN